MAGGLRYLGLMVIFGISPVVLGAGAKVVVTPGPYPSPNTATTTTAAGAILSSSSLPSTAATTPTPSTPNTPNTASRKRPFSVAEEQQLPQQQLPQEFRQALDHHDADTTNAISR